MCEHGAGRAHPYGVSRPGRRVGSLVMVHMSNDALERTAPIQASERRRSTLCQAKVERSMPLTRTEQWLLRRYAMYRERPPSFASLLRAALRQLLTIAVLGAASGYLLNAGGEPAAASFVAGAAFGAILRQLAQLRVAAAAAPVLSKIIDQDRVERLLQPE